VVIFSVVHLIFVIVWSQVDSNRNDKRKREEDAAIELKRQSSLTKINEAKKNLKSKKISGALE
jgi:hypothetical protein